MRADVIAFAGRPQSETHGRWGAGPVLDALGYHCHGRPHAIDLQAWCRTVFWLDSPTGTVALFYTTDSLYATPNDLHVGTRLRHAEHALHQTVRPACGIGQLRVSTPYAYLLLWIVGGHCSEPPSIARPGFD